MTWPHTKTVSSRSLPSPRSSSKRHLFTTYLSRCRTCSILGAIYRSTLVCFLENMQCNVGDACDHYYNTDKFLLHGHIGGQDCDATSPYPSCLYISSKCKLFHQLGDYTYFIFVATWVQRISYNYFKGL